MKFILGLILIFLATTLAIDERKRTLGDWYEEIDKNIDAKRVKMDWNDPMKKFTQSYNKYDIKQYMKYNDHKNKLVNFAEAMILIYGSILKHFDGPKQNEAWSSMVDLLIEFYNKPEYLKHLDCFRKELNEIDPNSPQVDENLDVTKCETIVDMAGLDNHITEVEKAYGNLRSLTGGKMDRTKYKKILLTFVILAGKSSTDRINDTRLLIGNLKSYLNEAFSSTQKELNTRQSIKTNHVYYRSHNGR